MEKPSSNLFEGYRCVGYVTGPLPFIVRHGKNPQDTRILSIVGKTIHTYSSNLSLLEVSIPHEHDITSITSDERNIFSASGPSVFVWGRSSRALSTRLNNKDDQSNIKIIVKFGTNGILTVNEENIITRWDLTEKQILNKIPFEEGTSKITALCCPMNYKDKTLVGFEQGRLMLWNVATEQCLYKFKGWDSAVTCIVQSPVKDVVAIGLADGHVFVHNIKYDETVVRIYQEYGPITSMSFRLDGQPYLVTASDVGHLMIWNLERKRLSSQIRNAHESLISKCQFIRNESLLVTSGMDNSIKIWAMNQSDGGGDLLCQRSGHRKPPSQIKFYGTKGFNLLSAGHDSTLKMFHIYSERLNRNLGTARINPKTKHKSDKAINALPPIVRFSAEISKEKQWDNIAACHENSSLVSTWNYDKCRMGDHIITQPTFDKHDVSASAICITGCGNFVVIGFSNGLIFKYNIQSGIFRQTYESDEVTEHRAHDGSVRGLTVDSLDVVLISGGSDGKLRMWNFKTGGLYMTITCASPVLNIELHRENNLLAIALENNDVEIMDLETREVIRKFTGPTTILDMTFSPDSRWLIISYADASIRTWDLNLGKLIDAFALSSPCVSLSISSTGEFLATAHKDSLGINIWCNYTIYCPTTLKSINPEASPTLLDMPFVKCDDIDQENQESGDRVLAESELTAELTYVSPEQLNKDLITLSSLPSSRWKHLLKIDELRKQQLIQEEAKKEKQMKIPFFIPVKDGLKPELDKQAVQRLNEANDPGKLSSKIQELRLLSPIAKCLIDCGNVNDYTPFLTQLKELGPSATDAEIRSLGMETCGYNQPMLCFLDAIEQALNSNLDYELVSSWLALFLKAHSDTIQEDSKTKERCFELSDPVRTRWNRLSEEFNQVFCVLNFVRSSIL